MRAITSRGSDLFAQLPRNYPGKGPRTGLKFAWPYSGCSSWRRWAASLGEAASALCFPLLTRSRARVIFEPLLPTLYLPFLLNALEIFSGRSFVNFLLMILDISCEAGHRQFQISNLLSNLEFGNAAGPSRAGQKDQSRRRARLASL